MRVTHPHMDDSISDFFHDLDLKEYNDESDDDNDDEDSLWNMPDITSLHPNPDLFILSPTLE